MDFRQRHAHVVERHRHVIAGTLSLARGMDQAVQLVILVAVAVAAAEFRFILLCQALWINVVGYSKDIVDGIVLILVAHDVIAAGCETNEHRPLFI